MKLNHYFRSSTASIKPRYSGCSSKYVYAPVNKSVKVSFLFFYSKNARVDITCVTKFKDKKYRDFSPSFKNLSVLGEKLSNQQKSNQKRDYNKDVKIKKMF